MKSIIMKAGAMKKKLVEIVPNLTMSRMLKKRIDSIPVRRDKRSRELI